jgi:DNA polymerase-1
MIMTHPKKSQQKKRRSIWSFEVIRWIFRRNHHKYYKTLQDTRNILIRFNCQGWSYYYKLIKTKLCLFWYWNYRTRCLACRVSRDFFLLEKGKDFTYPFRESGWSKSIAENLCLFENEKNEKIGQNLKYDLKILSNYGINVENYLTPWLLII